MQVKNTYILFVLAIIILLLSSCSNTKYLADNQNLYVGSKIKFESTKKLPKQQKNSLEAELEKLVRPVPNSKILGMRVKLWAYNAAGTPTGKGLKYWMKYKFGEPPVIATYTELQKNSSVLQNRLENNGYFHDTVTLDTFVKHQKLTAEYTAHLYGRYRIRNVTFPPDSNYGINKAISKTQQRTLLKPGRPFDLDRIKAERERINARLKQRGYFYFDPDYLILDVDSTVGRQKVDMDLHLKPETPPSAKKVYRINDVVVYADYDIQSDTSISYEKISQEKGLTIVDPNDKFNDKIFSRTIVVKPGDLYNRDKHNLSLNRLVTLGVYKFVKVRFEDADSVRGNKLNAFYYLTPTEKKSIRAEVSGLTKSNNATGTEFSVSWRNRNFLKGAELFTIGAYAGLEQQFSSARNARTLRMGGDLNLYAPRAPIKTNSDFVPKTRINLGYELYNSDTLYTLNSFKTSYGWQWKGSIKTEHQLNPIAISLVQPSKIDSAFQVQLDTNLTLSRSIERQFIIGSNYNFNLNTLAKPNAKRHNFYVNGNLDLSGNIMGLVSGASAANNNVKGLFNVPFAQYVRTEAELRHYLRLTRLTSFASRVWTGLGYAYGNSETMPFIKEFFAGGTNDIRAFRARSLGPGSFYAGNPTTFIPEQPGDIKIEANAEYRGAFNSIFRWAMFVDAGNVWTLREDSTRPGAKFSGNWPNELAVGAGLGLRIDISILILRIDLAVPVRKPYLPEGERWVFNKINLGDKDWRRENLVINLAIGYPF